MKHAPSGALTRASLLACAALCATSTVQAAKTWTGAASGSWTDIANWLEGALPGTTETLILDANSTGTLTLDLQADRTIRGITLTNPAGPVTFSNNRLFIGSGGINVATASQDLTLSSPANIIQSGAFQWNVPTGRTLAFSGIPHRNSPNNSHGGGNNDNVGGTVRVSPTGGTVHLTTPNVLVISDGVASQGGGNNPFMTFGDDAFAATDASGNVIAATNVAWNASVGSVFSGSPGAVGASFTQSGNGGFQGIVFNDATTAHTVSFQGSTTFTGRAILMTPDCVGGTITGGFLRVNRSNTAGASFSIIQNSTAGDLTIASVISMASSNTPTAIIKSGAGKLILAGNNGNNGRTFIHEGTLQIGAGGTTGTLSGANVINHAALVFDRMDASTAAQVISGTGTLTKNGSGTLTLGNANTYTGATTLNGGLVNIGSTASFGATSSLTLDGGGIQWSAPADISAIPTTLAASGTTLDTNAQVVTLANSIGNSGSGFIVKTGAGTLTLAAGNLYSGGTTVSAGTLLATNASGSATGSGLVTLQSGATLGGTGTIDGPVTVESGAKVSPGTSVGNLTVGDLVLDPGAILDFEFGSGNDTVTISNPGGLVINGGAIQLLQEGNPNAFSTIGTYNLFAYSGGIGGTGTAALTIANPQPGFSYTFGESGGFVTLTIATSGVVRDWITDGSGSWNNAGNWNGTAPNGTSHIANFNTPLSGPATVTLDGAKTLGAITFLSAAHSFTIAPGSGGSLTLNNGSNGASILDGAGTHAIQVPIILVSDTVVDTAALADSITLGAEVSGSGTLTKTGPGSLELLGNNSFTGKLTLSGGTTTFAPGGLGAGDLDIDASTLAWASGNTDDITSGGRVITFGTSPVTFDTNGNDVTLAGDFGGAGTSALTKSGLGALSLDADATFTGDVTIAAGSLQLGTGGATGSVTPINLVNNGQLVVNRNTDLLLSSVITGTGGLAQNGPSILDLNAANTFTGDTTIASGATIRLFNSLGLSGSTLVYPATGGMLDFDSNFAVTLGALSGDKDLALNNSFLGPVTLTVGGNNASTSYSGIISGDGGLSKSGTGVMTLSTAHSYLGTTNVSNGGGTGGLVLESGAVINGGALNITQTSQVIVDQGASLTASATSSVSNAGGFNPRLDIEGGSVAFNGGLNALGNANNNYMIRLDGGIFSASTVNLGRGGLNQGLTEPGATGLTGSAGLGLVIVDGTATITGAFNVGAAGATTNSTASARIDGGSLTVDGPLTIGVNNGGRYSGFDVTGGTFTSTDAVGGVILGQTVAGPAAFLVRGGTATVERIQFGQAAVNSIGVTHVFDGELYVGTGGMVLGSTDPGFIATLKLSGGTLGAKGDWATSLPVVTANSFEVKAADAANTPFNITFSGPVSGTGSLEKSGGGTLAITGTYSYSGGTNVTGGTLTLDSGTLSDTGVVDISTGAVLNLNFAGTDTVDDFRIDGTPQGDGTFGAIGSGADTETALITGTGILLVLPKDPFIGWADSFGLAGLDAEKSADADKDGLDNLLEFALDSDPTSGAASGKVRSRIETVGGDQALVITLPVRDGAVFSGSTAQTAVIDGITYTVSGSNTLAAFDEAVSEIAVSASGMPALNTGWTYRSFRLDGAIPTRGATGFLRADVTEAAP
jgi:autotransporter-associated beta strand protein